MTKDIKCQYLHNFRLKRRGRKSTMSQTEPQLTPKDRNTINGNGCLRSFSTLLFGIYTFVCMLKDDARTVGIYLNSTANSTGPGPKNIPKKHK